MVEGGNVRRDDKGKTGVQNYRGIRAWYQKTEVHTLESGTGK